MTLRHRFARLVFIPFVATLGFFASSDTARGQCLDWAPGFGLPGDGLDSGPDQFLVWNDGGGNALYAAGGFENAGGVPASRVARWNGSSWTSVGDVLNNAVRAIAVFDDGSGPALYAGGSFFPSGTSSAQGIARLVGSTWTAFTDSPLGSVRALAVFDDGSGPALIVGGNFTNIGAASFDRIAKWDGASWSSLGTGMDGTVDALIVFDDGGGPALYAGGNFLLAGGVSVVRVAKWDGIAWSAVGALPPVEDFFIYDHGSGPQLHAGGDSGGGVKRWNGTAWQTLGTFNGSALSFAAHDDGSGQALYMGSDVLRKWNGSSWVTLGVGPGVSNPRIEALASFDDGSGGGARLFAGGSFTTAGGHPAMNFSYWGHPCFAPVISQQPVSQTAVFNEPIVFSVVGDGSPTVTYRWRKNGVPIADEFKKIAGTLTPTLTFYHWDYGDNGSYTCKLQNAQGNVTSDAAVLTVPLGGEAESPFELDKILLPPEPVPGHSGLTYTHFIDPIQSSTGDVTFFANISGSGSGDRSISAWRSGATELLYQQQDPAPGTPAGVVFGGGATFSSYDIGPGGGVVFRSEVTGPGVDASNRVGLWYRDSTGADLVMRLGSQAGGSPSGATFQSMHYKATVDDSGQVLFWGRVFQSGSFLESGLWTWKRSSGQAQVVVTGDSAPGTTETFTSIDAFASAYGLDGTLAFVGEITGPSWGIWAGTLGSLQLVARVGDAVPGWSPGTTFQSFADPVLNDSGELAFSARVQNGGGPLQQAVFRWDTSTISTIVAQGDVVPDRTTHAFVFPKPIVMNNAGAMVFYSDISYPGCPTICPTKGYFYADSLGIKTIVTDRADPLPEAPPGFDLGWFHPVALNDSGQVLVNVDLYGGERFGAVYGWLREYGLFPIAVPGTQFEIAPGVYRTVAGASISYDIGGISGDEGPSVSLTNDGKAVLSIGFTNFTVGIFSGHFTGFGALYFPPGTSYCAGDGSLPTPCPCANTGQPGRGCENSIATGGAHLTSFGGASLSEDTVVLTSAGERPTSISILLQGTTNIAAGVTYGDGVRCVGGALKRIITRNAVDGTLAYPLAGDPSISARSATLGNPIIAGSTRYYQTYYRDGTASFCPMPPGNTFNVSNGQIIQWFP